MRTIKLITGGEEGGLRGANGFVQEHPLMANVKLIVNLEARAHIVTRIDLQ